MSSKGRNPARSGSGRRSGWCQRCQRPAGGTSTCQATRVSPTHCLLGLSFGVAAGKRYGPVSGNPDLPTRPHPHGHWAENVCCGRAHGHTQQTCAPENSGFTQWDYWPEEKVSQRSWKRTDFSSPVTLNPCQNMRRDGAKGAPISVLLTSQPLLYLSRFHRQTLVPA